MSSDMREIEKMPFGIPGFDHISYGGLPKLRTTLLSGAVGSGKTTFAVQFLVEGILRGENGVFVTFEETAEDIRMNVASLGWDIAQWEADGKWAFVDASPSFDEMIVIGDYDLGALLARIEHAVSSVNAQRLAIDSKGVLEAQFESSKLVRREIQRIVIAIRGMKVTAIVTADRKEERGDIQATDVKEFVTDNVLVLSNVLKDEKRWRTIEILKFRGANHQKGEFPFSIIPGEGIVILPLSAIELSQKTSDVRVTSGIPELDKLSGGGFFRDSINLVSGASGTGKTLIAKQFISGGINQGERPLLFAFEESRDQLFRNAGAWGADFEEAEKEGRLKLVCAYPESGTLEDHMIRIKKIIEEFKPTRVAVDSLSALERISTLRSYKAFIFSLASLLKAEQITGLFTITTSTLTGRSSITEGRFSTLSDSIILLRYVEVNGEVRRGLTILKMRGSEHDKNINEFTIHASGMNIGKPFRNISGILAGNIGPIPGM
jgi:circadian clock protein KaiC